MDFETFKSQQEEIYRIKCNSGKNFNDYYSCRRFSNSPNGRYFAVVVYRGYVTYNISRTEDYYGLFIYDNEKESIRGNGLIKWLDTKSGLEDMSLYIRDIESVGDDGIVLYRDGNNKIVEVSYDKLY